MKIGEKISVLDEDLEGIITSIHGENIIFKDEHGFSHQYQKSKIILKNKDLYENIPKKIEKFSEIIPKSKKHKKSHLVLDLHFEQLVPQPNNYDSFERLFLQKEKLLETIEFCRNNNLKKLEVIHGLGDGTLQKMVRDVLESQTGIDFYNKEILHHQSGAIMIEFY